MKQNKNYYFSTRDLMMMAALAALGGIASTYINMIGDFFQSLLGFAGTTQWAAGLHVLWLMLASVLVGKPGAASITGLLKGFVELFTGNTHGILVLIVDIVAGLVVDFVLLLSKDKKPDLLFFLAAGLSSASNVIVFQLFASLPADVLAFIAILATSLLAFVSGVVFGGMMGRSLIKALERIGMIHKRQAQISKTSKVWAMIIIASALLITMLGGSYIYNSQTKVSSIVITGDVKNPYEYPASEYSPEFIEREIESNGVARKYEGIFLKDVVDHAGPITENGVVMIEATDGYSFFVSMQEIVDNGNLLINIAETKDGAVYNIVGAESSKAWVRGVSRIVILPKDTMEVGGNAAAPYTFAPQEWQDRMDSIYFSIEGTQEKLQGVPLVELVNEAEPNEIDYSATLTNGEESFKITANDLIDNSDLRVFTFPKESGFEFLLGKMDGSILLRYVTEIRID